MSIHATRNPYVDALRGLAITCVLLLHFSLAYGLKNSPLTLLVPDWLLARIVWNGNYGVTMFFVVSGFLITSTIIQRWGHPAALDLRTFYVLRLARILPLLLIALGVIVLLGTAGWPYFSNTDNHQHLPASFFVIAAGSVLTFWHNLLMQHVGYFNYSLNVYWSLSVEEVFYLVWPLLCLGMRRIRYVLLCCVALLIVGPVYRAFHLDNEIDYLYGYWACFDAIALGCMTALLAQTWRVPAKMCSGLRWSSVAVLAVVYLFGIEGHQVFGFSGVALCSAAYLWSAQHSSVPSLWAMRLSAPLRWLGQHSYEMYLFHIIVLALLRNGITREALSYGMRLPLLALFVIASAALAGLMSRYVGEPLNRFLRTRYV